ncbi:type II toxin-antitoxin system Phd/YefM family antitoxin [Microtetraspora malaysiensis]|uniref:type II toxin-antitoxin system Phd/YefM family antitoxin n=1 Tax=Microtetraspora malaysiensis TaxID=161358 RepID=UPI003D8F0EDE
MIHSALRRQQRNWPIRSEWSVTHDHFTVTRNGRPAVVVVSIAEWESLHETLSILADADEISAIRAGLVDDAHGDVATSEEVATAMADRRKLAG